MRNTFDTIRSAIQRVTLYLGMAGMVMLLILMLLTCADVIGRKFFSPVPGAFELSQHMFTIFGLLGLAFVQQVEGYITVDIFVNRMPLRAQLVLDIITTLLSLFIVSFIVWQGWLEAIVSLKGGTASAILYIPEFPFRFLLPVGGFFLFLELLFKLITTIGKVAKMTSQGGQEVRV